MEHEGRGGLGVVAMKLVAERVRWSARWCEPDDSIFAIASNGVVIRNAGRGHPADRPADDGRQSHGLGDGVTVVAVARLGGRG